MKFNCVDVCIQTISFFYLSRKDKPLVMVEVMIKAEGWAGSEEDKFL